MPAGNIMIKRSLESEWMDIPSLDQKLALGILECGTGTAIHEVANTVELTVDMPEITNKACLGGYYIKVNCVLIHLFFNLSFIMLGGVLG